MKIRFWTKKHKETDASNVNPFSNEYLIEILEAEW
jgi:hypothetical protein